MRELEETARLARAEAWQGTQAWTPWEKIAAGDRRDVSMKQLREHTARALAELDTRTGRR